MRSVQFTTISHEQLLFWKKTNPKIYSRILQLIDAINNSPFTGIGKPEPLKADLSGYWSRRINKEHRLVYRVTKNTIIIIACRYHY